MMDGGAISNVTHCGLGGQTWSPILVEGEHFAGPPEGSQCHGKVLI